MKSRNESARMLFEALYSNDIHELIKTAYNVLQCPVIFTDTSYKKLTEIYPADAVGDPKWDIYLQGEELDLASIQSIFEYDEISSMREHYSSFFMNTGFFEDSPRATAPIVLNGELAGYVSVYLKERFPDGKADETFLEELSLVAEAVAIHLRSLQSTTTDQVSLRHFFARSLLTGELREPAEMKKWSELLGLDLQPRYLILALGPVSKERQNYGYYIQEQLESSGLPVLLYSSEKHVYALLYHSESQDDCYRILRQIEEVLGPFRFRCGVSRSFLDFTDVKRYVQQASVALETGKRRRPEETLYFFRELVLRAMADDLLATFGEENCRHPALSLLEAHDRESNGLYMETLRTYVLSSFHSHETCEKLHIHRNTLAYRLNRIEELTGEDLSDRATRLHLALNFLME